MQDGPVDSQTLDFLFYGGTELGGGRWQSGLGSYMSSCLFVLLPLPIMGWGRWAGVVWGEGRKGHITARGYGGPEPASWEQRRNPGFAYVKLLLGVVGGGGGGYWEAEDKEAGTQGFKTFEKTTG